MVEIQRKWIYLEPIFGRYSNSNTKLPIYSSVTPSHQRRLVSREWIMSSEPFLMVWLASFQLNINSFRRRSWRSTSVSVQSIRSEEYTGDNRGSAQSMSTGSQSVPRGTQLRIWNCRTENTPSRCMLHAPFSSLNGKITMATKIVEDKRSAFSRFYFLGDDDLLEILGQSTNPAVIQQHLKKLFQVRRFYSFIKSFLLVSSVEKQLFSGHKSSNLLTRFHVHHCDGLIARRNCESIEID